MNQGGNASETATAAKYASYNRKNFSYNSTPWSFQSIKTRIGADVPFICSLLPSGGNVGHMVVCYGYTDNTVYNTQLIHYIDPSNGLRHHCEYQDFLDGTYNGKDYMGNVWYV